MNLIVSMVTNRKRQVQMAETLKLIRLYRANDCLWNPSSSDYKNALMKERAWQFIANFFNQSLTVEQIKWQVASLRYVFTTELLTMKRRKMEGYDYIPHFKYFKEMEFLKDVIMPSVNVKSTEVWNIKSHLLFLKKNISEFQSEALDLINYIADDSFLQNSIHNDSVDHMTASFESNEDSIRNAWLPSQNKAVHFEATPTYNLGNRNCQNRMCSGEDNRNAAAKRINYDSESASPSTPVRYSDSNYTTWNEMLPSLEGGATWDPSLSQITYVESETAKQYAPIKKVLTGKYIIKPKAQDSDFDQRQRYKNIRATDRNMRIDSGTTAAAPAISDEKLNDRYENCIRHDCEQNCSPCPYDQSSYSYGFDTHNRQGEQHGNENIVNIQNNNSNDKKKSHDEISHPIKDSELPDSTPVGYEPAREQDRRLDNETTRLPRRGEYEDASHQSQSPTKQRSDNPEQRKNNLLMRTRNLSPDHGKKLLSKPNNDRYAANSQRASHPKRSTPDPDHTEKGPKRLVCTHKRERLNVPHVDNLILCPIKGRSEYEDGIMETQANDHDKTINTELPPFGYNDNSEYENGQTARPHWPIDEYRYRDHDVSKSFEFNYMRNISTRNKPEDFEDEFAQRQRQVINTHDRGGPASPKFGDIKLYKCYNGRCESSPRSPRSPNNMDDFALNYRWRQDMPDNNFTRRYEDDYSRPNDQFSQDLTDQKLRRGDEYNRGIELGGNSYAMTNNTWEYPREHLNEHGEERGYRYCSCKQKWDSANYRKPIHKFDPDYDQPMRPEFHDEHAHPLASSPRQQDSNKRNNYNRFTTQHHGNAGRNIGIVRDNPADRWQSHEHYRPDERDDNNKSSDSNDRIKGQSPHSDHRSLDDHFYSQGRRNTIRPIHNWPASSDNSEVSQKSKAESADNRAGNLYNKFNNSEEMILYCDCPTDDDEAGRENVKNLRKPDICFCEAAVETDIDMTLHERRTPSEKVDPKESKSKAGIIEDDKKKNADEKDQPLVKPKPSTGGIRKPCSCKPSQQKNKSKAASQSGVKSEKLKQRIASAAAKYRSHFNRNYKLEDDPAATNDFQRRSSGKVSDGLCNEGKNVRRCRSNVETTRVLTFEVPSNYVERTIAIVNNHVMNDLSKVNPQSSGVCLVTTKITKGCGNRTTSNPFIKIDVDTANKEIIVLHPPVNEFRSSSRNSITMPDVSHFHNISSGQSKKSVNPMPAKSKQFNPNLPKQ